MITTVNFEDGNLLEEWIYWDGPTMGKIEFSGDNYLFLLGERVKAAREGYTVLADVFYLHNWKEEYEGRDLLPFSDLVDFVKEINNATPDTIALWFGYHEN